MKRYRRMDRVDELLKEEIATAIRDVKDPRVGFVTVMDVATSRDLRHARVYVSVLGEQAVERATLEALRRASGFIRARVGEAVTLKYLPALAFELDHSIERAARIDTLIDEMRADVGAEDAAADETSGKGTPADVDPPPTEP